MCCNPDVGGAIVRLSMVPTGRHVSEIKGGVLLARIMSRLKAFIADKAYDCARLRTTLETTGTQAVNLSK